MSKKQKIAAVADDLAWLKEFVSLFIEDAEQMHTISGGWGYSARDIPKMPWRHLHNLAVVEEVLKRMSLNLVEGSAHDVTALVKGIRLEAEAEARKILAKARDEATEILAKAKADAAIIRADASVFIDKEVEERLDRMVGRAATIRRKRSLHLQGKKIVLVDV